MVLLLNSLFSSSKSFDPFASLIQKTLVALKQGFLVDPLFGEEVFLRWEPETMADDTSDQGFEFKLSSPDYTASPISPENSREEIQETPEYIRRSRERKKVAPVGLFLEKGFGVLKMESRMEDKSIEEGINCDKVSDFEASIELGVIPDVQETLMSINAGCLDESVVCGDFDFEVDKFYSGGDTIKTDAQVGDGSCGIYQSARLGNFSYQFTELEAGNYLVDLHFAEIVFADGPVGMRIFDVFIQNEKVLAGLDIYGQVGSNQPLILSDLRASVLCDEGLLITFEGIMGQPIVSGISVRRDSASGKTFQRIQGEQAEASKLVKVDCDQCRKLKKEFQFMLNEHSECKQTLESLKKENELKNRECHQAWLSLQQLQMELMQKSMHVGSLAFAIEGQVKEKMDRHIKFEKEHEDLKLRFNEEANERKELYNKIIELKGNIRVFCRCRPLNMEEKARGDGSVIDFGSAKDGGLIVKGHVSSTKLFKFDSVFSPEEDQEAVFKKTAPFATSVLDGYNVCIFAFGQTGTGKTFTMEGTEEARGVNYRTLEEIFRIIRERQGLHHYEVTVSVLEVYNEQIHDLLLSGSEPGVASKKLEVKQVAEGVHVPGLVEAPVTNMNEAWEVLQTGSKARAVGSTNANEHSSRSHCIHCVMIKGENLVNGECTRSKLWLIDLAGSERVAKTDAQGERLKEAQNINKSLSALGNVISALATKSQHIPFRNSKLTHLLQDSLGGDSKTLMFVQISPNEEDLGETLCSLNFASRVRGIELGLAKRQIDMSEMSRYKHMFGKVKEDMKQKESQMKKMEETIQSLEVKNKAKELINTSLQDKIKELESQLLIERKLARQHVDNRIAENHQLQQQQLQQQKHKEQEESSSCLRTNCHASEQVIDKEFDSVLRPFTENNSNRPLLSTPNDSNIFKHFRQFKDKENKPEIPEEPFPRKASRVSLCPTVRGLPITPVSRRNSLIPFPVTKPTPPTPQLTNVMNFSPSLPLQARAIYATDDPTEGEIINQGRSNKKINSILRRSLQKKVIIRPQLPQSMRTGATLSGIDKLRLSVGRSGRKSRRMAAVKVGDGDRVIHHKQQKEKERGWNLGATTSRHIF
ncbi:hypothetical protein ZIOFF_065328 [Zingiber officinale]|uniref:Kinesin motor domain-containing protein n=1 Tax=Zingiber officinale TaxID=94328 RepID=A0A8J5EX70_ZINOF|nr:hypothetical protein ZIOFF_065328 [Zingiber officinale]